MAERRSAYQARRFKASLPVMDQDSAPEQTMCMARLRPVPFSSTTVALASCSSDHFPKRTLYISDVRESRCAPGPRLASFSKGSPAHAALRNFLAPATKAREGSGSGDRARSRRWEIGLSGTSPSRAATQEHWPRHGRSMGRLDTAAHIQQPGSAMFHLGQHPCSEQMISRRAKGDSARRRRH